MGEPNKLLYSTTEAAFVASVSRPTLYRWMRLEGFPVVKIGNCTRIPVDEFRRWLENQAEVRADA